MTAQQETAAKILTSSIFAGALLIAGVALYYSYLEWNGDPCNQLTNILALLIEKQSRISNLLGTILPALPSIAIPVCMANNSELTRFGRFAAVSLTATFLLTLTSTMVITPSDDSTESKAVAVAVEHISQVLASFSLAYLGLLFGYKLKSSS
jgi:hypothetical protein